MWLHATKHLQQIFIARRYQKRPLTRLSVSNMMATEWQAGSEVETVHDFGDQLVRQLRGGSGGGGGGGGGSWGGGSSLGGGRGSSYYYGSSSSSSGGGISSVGIIIVVVVLGEWFMQVKNIFVIMNTQHLIHHCEFIQCYLASSTAT